MKSLFKGQKGITLIALVITIIVLLILAGVTIAMLTGQNGILTNATNANSSSVYYGAEEQVKIAYMSVITQIMTEKVANSSYNAQDSSNVTLLTDIVKKDLNTTKTVDQITEGTGEGFGVTASGSEINIIYKNSKIHAGTISRTNPVKPSTNGKATYKITLEEQNAILTVDGQVINGQSSSSETVTDSEDLENPDTTPTGTLSDYLTLREGETVYYKDADDKDIQCIVLYDSQNTNYSSYGVQIITRDPVDKVSLGGLN